MSERRAPERTCVACRGKGPKAELLRVVRGPDGSVRLDASGRAEGRGAYVHASPECTTGAFRGAALSRALRAALRPAEAASLRRELSERVGVA